MARIDTRTLAAALAFLIALGAILGAWAFQLIGHYIPCKLCLQERIPYYVGLPIAGAALLSAAAGGPGLLTRLLLLATAAVFAWSTWLGVYHAGVEYDWWLGPSDCGGAPTTATDAGGLLGQLRQIRIVSCSEASWRFPAGWGLSFAGWNAAASAAIMAVALAGAALRGRTAAPA